MAMSVKVFDSLVARDFQNGAIRDEIRSSLKELERRGGKANPADKVLRCDFCGEVVDDYLKHDCGDS